MPSQHPPAPSGIVIQENDYRKHSFSGLQFPHVKNIDSLMSLCVMQIKQENEIYALQSKP